MPLAPPGEIGAPAADRPRCYLVPLLLVADEPLPLGLLGVVAELLELEPEDGLVVDGDVVVVLEPGDADGVRSAGRSPTRSVRVSLQAVSSPRLSATAKTAVSFLFMTRCLLYWGCATFAPDCNGHAAARP